MAMVSRGTVHLTLNEFHDAILNGKPGERIIYATGDIGYSARWSDELKALRERVWLEAYDRRGRLSQRRLANSEIGFIGGGSRFEYIFTLSDRPATKP